MQPKSIDLIDPRLRRDDVLRELCFRVKSAIGGRSSTERKTKAVKKNAKLATKAANEARKKRNLPKPTPSTKIRPTSSWD